MSRVVLITGGSKGIGLACAQHFASLGDKVAISKLKPVAVQKIEVEGDV